MNFINKILKEDSFFNPKNVNNRVNKPENFRVTSNNICKEIQEVLDVINIFPEIVKNVTNEIIQRRFTVNLVDLQNTKYGGIGVVFIFDQDMNYETCYQFKKELSVKYGNDFIIIQDDSNTRKIDNVNVETFYITIACRGLTIPI